MKTRLLPKALFVSVSLTTLVHSQETKPIEIPDALDLQTSLEFALQNNYDILTAKQRIEEQNGLIIEVRADALPDVSLSGQYTELDGGLTETFGLFPETLTNWSIALNARQTLYAGGGVRAALNAQRMIEEAAVFELQSIINDVLLQTRENFYTALVARERIQVQEENIALLSEQLEDARQRLDAGTVSRFEVLRAEVDLANARPDLIRARSDFRLSVEELRTVLGFSKSKSGGVEKIPDLLGKLEYTANHYDLERSLVQAISFRPELRRLELVAQAREEGIKIARSDGRPEIAALAAYQLNKSSFSNSIDDGLHGWIAGVEVSVPVFDGRRTKGRVIQAKSQADQAKLEFDHARLLVEVEVRRALSDVREAQELADASVFVVNQAEEALKMADARYDARDASQLDLIQARVALTEAKLNQVEAYFRYNLAEAQARRAIGIADRFTDSESP